MHRVAQGCEAAAAHGKHVHIPMDTLLLRGKGDLAALCWLGVQQRKEIKDKTNVHFSQLPGGITWQLSPGDAPEHLLLQISFHLFIQVCKEIVSQNCF